MLWVQPEQVFVPLAISSIMGIIIGDSAWLTALKLIGARKVIFVDSLKPFLAAFFGSLLNDEPFTIQSGLALCCCTIGIVMVCLENESRNDTEKSSPPETVIELVKIKPNYSPLQTDALEDEEEAEAVALGITDIEENSYNTIRYDTSSVTGDGALSHASYFLPQVFGYCCASINVLFDVYGSVLTKQNGVELNTWEVNFVRFGFAGFCMTIFSCCAYLMRVVSEMETWERHANPAVAYNNESVTKVVDIEEIPPVNAPYASALDVVDSKQAEPTRSAPWYGLPTSADMVPLDWCKVSGGVLFVTLICPALANYSLFKLDLGVALTLNSLGPLYSLPVSVMFAKLALRSGNTKSVSARDVITWRGMGGTVITFVGLVLLCV